MVPQAREYRLSPRYVFINHFCVKTIRRILTHNLLHSHSAAKDQSKAMSPVYRTRVSDDHSPKLDSNPTNTLSVPLEICTKGQQLFLNGIDCNLAVRRNI